VRSPVPGEVRAVLARDGADVAAGTPLAVVSPGEEHVWEGLRGLFLVGASNDLELVRHYVRGVPGMPPRIQRQAALTAQEIERRNGE